MNYTSNFDLDLKDGEIAEEIVRRLLGSKKVEVKWDKLAMFTGNLAIEIESRGKPSGLSTTEADWWCFVLGSDLSKIKRFVFIETDELKQLAEMHPSVVGGDNNTSVIKLIPLEGGPLWRGIV